jgi:hypothetical protein
MRPLDRLLIESRKRREARDGTTTGGLTKFQRAAQTLYELCFGKQQRILKDRSRRIAVRCPRRAGKTTVVRARLMRRCLLYPGSNCLYIALTRPSAEKLMWLGKSGLKAVCKALDLVEDVDVTFHNAKLMMTFSNGSTITLAGASTTDEIDKFRGDEYDEVWIDEAKSYAPKLFAELLEEALAPALMTRLGTLGMIGTPGNILDGKFYSVTRPGSEESKGYEDEEVESLWSFHEWTLEDNTAQPHQWREALRAKAANGWTDRNPIWKREYLGQWAADDTDSVYKFRKHLDDGTPWNIWTPSEATKANPFGLPPKKSWSYVYGMDLGAADPFALVILAYSDDAADLYQVYEYTVPRKQNFTSTQIGELLARLVEQTGQPLAMISDHSHLGASILAEIQARYGFYIEGAARGHSEKTDAIELTNGDLVDGRLRLFEKPGVKNQTMEQMLTLQWDESGVREVKSQANHLTDALIYARAKCLHYHAAEPEPEGPAYGTPEYVQAELDRAEEEAAFPDGDGGDLSVFSTGEDWA